MATQNHQPEHVPYRRRDGAVVQVFVPHNVADIENQPDIPAAVLACVALAPVVNGRRSWSPYTLSTLHRLADSFGDDVLRRHLSALVGEMAAGFKPSNPVGLFIHRVRQTPTQSTLV